MTIGELMDRNYEEGRKVGVQEGIEQGIGKGIEKGVLQVAKELKAEGVSIEIVMKTTGLSMAEIEKI